MFASCCAFRKFYFCVIDFTKVLNVAVQVVSTGNLQLLPAEVVIVGVVLQASLAARVSM